MSQSQLLSLLACAGELGLLVLIVWRGRASALSVPLALLTVALLGWNFSALAFSLTKQLGWLWASRAFGPWPVPLAVHVILVFVGRRRQMRVPLLLAYGCFVTLSMVAALGPWVTDFEAFTSQGSWERSFLAGLLPATALSLSVLVHHARTAHDDEVTRTYLVLAASVLLSLTAVTELLPETMNPPRLANVGTLGFNVLLTVVALRLRVVEQESRVFVFSIFLSIALLSWLGFLTFSNVLRSQWAAQLLAALVVSTGALVAGRFVFQNREIRKARLDRLAFLGRMSAQLAHDLKNPLAAAKGAAQFLETELNEGRSLQAHASMMTLLSQQLGRMEKVVSQYQRMSRVEPQLAQTSLNQIARAGVGFLALGADKALKVTLSLDESLEPIQVDGDLLTTALENLLSNAATAMSGQGSIVVSTRKISIDDASWQILSVKDDGPGMTARVKERAFDDFFTTRATGSGLGLPYVRRVAEAHRGHVVLESSEGRGTTVELHLPT